MLVPVDVDDQYGNFGGAGRSLPQRALPATRNLGVIQEPVHAGQQLHEDTELRGANRSPTDDLTPVHLSRHRRPCDPSEGLEAERYQALLDIEPPHLRG